MYETRNETDLSAGHHDCAASFGRDPGDGVPGLRVGERDPLQYAVQYRAPTRAGHQRGHKDIFHPDGPRR